MNNENRASKYVREDRCAAEIAKALIYADLPEEDFDRVANQGVFYALMRQAQRRKRQHATDGPRHSSV